MNNYNYTTNNVENKPKRTFYQLKRKDRIIIETLIRESKKKDYHGPKITCRFLASKIGCSPSTISRELKRGSIEELNSQGHYESNYHSDTGCYKRKESSKRSHYKTKLVKKCPELKYIEQCLKDGEDIYSAIINYKINNHKDFPVCEKTLYNYFHKRMMKGIKPYRKSKRVEKVQKMAQKGLNISERPFKMEDREEFGHWEGDLIVGSRGAGKDCLLTLIERQSRFYYAIKIKSKHTTSVIEGLNKLENLIGSKYFKKLFKTITFDNGVEFRDFKGMERSITNDGKRTTIYFANPYHSWERGSNERGNRMMRKFFPKGTDFHQVTNKRIQEALEKINYSHRRILNGLTSMEKIEKLEDDISIIFKKFKLTNCFLNN